MTDPSPENKEYKELVDTVRTAESADTPVKFAEVDAPEAEDTADLATKVEQAIQKGEENIEGLAKFMGEFGVDAAAYKTAKLEAYRKEIEKINTNLKSKLEERSQAVNTLIEGILADVEKPNSTKEIDIQAWGKVLEGEITMDKANKILDGFRTENPLFMGTARNLSSDLRLKLELACAIAQGSLNDYIVNNRRNEIREKMLSPPTIPEASNNVEGTSEIKISFKSIYDILGIQAPKNSEVAKKVQKEIKIGNLFTNEEIQRIVSVKSGTTISGKENEKTIDASTFFATQKSEKTRGLYTGKNKYIPIFDGAVITFANKPKNENLKVEGVLTEETTGATEEAPASEPAPAEGAETETAPKAEPTAPAEEAPPAPAAEGAPVEAEPATEPTPVAEKPAPTPAEKPAEAPAETPDTATKAEPTTAEQKAEAPESKEKTKSRVNPSTLTEQKAVEVLGDPHAYMEQEDFDLLMESAAVLAPWALMNNIALISSIDPNLPGKLIEKTRRSQNKERSAVSRIKGSYEPDEIQEILTNLDLPEYRNNPVIKQILKKVLSALVEDENNGANLFFRHIEAIHKIDKDQTKEAYGEFTKAENEDSILKFIIPIAEFLVKEEFSKAEDLLLKAVEKEPAMAIKHIETLLRIGIGAEVFEKMPESNPKLVIEMALDLMKSESGRAIVKKTVEINPTVAILHGEKMASSGDGRKLLISAINKILEQKSPEKAIILIRGARTIKKLNIPEGSFLGKAVAIASTTKEGRRQIIESFEDLEGAIENHEKVIRESAEKFADEAPEDFLRIAKKLVKFKWLEGLVKKVVGKKEIKENFVFLLEVTEILSDFRFGRSMLEDIKKKNPDIIIDNADKLSEHGAEWALPIFESLEKTSPWRIIDKADKISNLPYGERLIKSCAEKRPELVVEEIDKFEKFLDKEWVRKAIEETAKIHRTTFLIHADKLKTKFQKQEWLDTLIRITINLNRGSSIDTKTGPETREMIVDSIINSNDPATILNKADKLFETKEGKAAVKKWAELRPELVPVFIEKLKGYDWVPTLLKEVVAIRYPNHILASLEKLKNFDMALCGEVLKIIKEKHPKLYEVHESRKKGAPGILLPPDDPVVDQEAPAPAPESVVAPAPALTPPTIEVQSSSTPAEAETTEVNAQTITEKTKKQLDEFLEGSKFRIGKDITPEGDSTPKYKRYELLDNSNKSIENCTITIIPNGNVIVSNKNSSMNILGGKLTKETLAGAIEEQVNKEILSQQAQKEAEAQTEAQTKKTESLQAILKKKGSEIFTGDLASLNTDKNYKTLAKNLVGKGYDDSSQIHISAEKGKDNIVAVYITIDGQPRIKGVASDNNFQSAFDEACKNIGLKPESFDQESKLKMTTLNDALKKASILPEGLNSEINILRLARALTEKGYEERDLGNIKFETKTLNDDDGTPVHWVLARFDGEAMPEGNTPTKQMKEGNYRNLEVAFINLLQKIPQKY